jgi:hypothetical protein
LLHQPRDVAAMVEVRVRKDDRLDLVGRNGRGFPIALPPFFLSLEKAAVDEDLQASSAGVAGDVEQMFGTGDGSGCAEELDVGHGQYIVLGTSTSGADLTHNE